MLANIMGLSHPTQERVQPLYVVNGITSSCGLVNPAQPQSINQFETADNAVGVHPVAAEGGMLAIKCLVRPMHN